MSNRIMTRAEIESDLTDIVAIAFAPTVWPGMEVTLKELGFEDQFECVEVLMAVEERFGEKPFVNFMPTPETTLNQFAGLIEQAFTVEKG